MEAKKQTGFRSSEILDTRDIELFSKKPTSFKSAPATCRTLSCSKVGACDKPVLLKQGLSATIKEFLLSAGVRHVPRQSL